MTDEKFERACEIRESINTIVEIQNTLGNSQNKDGKHYLAAIEAKDFSHGGLCVTDCSVLNHIKVPEYIMKRFEEVLWEEFHKLQEEFKAL